jgi:2-C-methyl-D-erythritol 4-phosphate cytidylyltransferase
MEVAMSIMAVLIACGKEEEIAPGTDTAFLPLGNGPIISHSLKTLELSPTIDSVVVVVSKERVESTIQVIKRFGCTKVHGIVVGGVSRMSSLRSVFSKIQMEPTVVMIHEASRPFLTQKMIVETVKCAKRYGCSIAAHRIPDATKLAPKGLRVAETLDRNAIWAAQTPQVFKASVMKGILETKGAKISDDESEFVPDGFETHMIEVGGINMKIRSKADLEHAGALLNAKLVGDDMLRKRSA